MIAITRSAGMPATEARRMRRAVAIHYLAIGLRLSDERVWEHIDDLASEAEPAEA